MIVSCKFSMKWKSLLRTKTEFGAKHKDAKLRISAQQVKPLPYWRDKVTDDLLLKPDIVTPKSHTVCWKGVVSHVVCTSGSKVCW